MPLMVTADDQIISFAYLAGKNCSFFFPTIERKQDFLLGLLQTVLPGIFANLFPYSTQFAWLEDPLYWLPKEEALLKEKSTLEQEYQKSIGKIEEKIRLNRERYHYLHDLLIQTGDALVKTVEKYFKWLGFENVINLDETNPDLREEDIQIEMETGLLVVEVKGIAGTSTDSECSQISKIKYRRAKQRGSFDVYALYLVNHQRFLPPEERSNPPFTEHQINDAENDERGLLTTYDLYKLHFNIEAGFVTKEDARNSLLHNGLVQFPPSNAAKIALPYEIHHNGFVVIVELSGIEIRKGISLILDDGGLYRSAHISEIQVQGTCVDSADAGEVGIRLTEKVFKQTELWINTEI